MGTVIPTSILLSGDQFLCPNQTVTSVYLEEENIIYRGGGLLAGASRVSRTAPGSDSFPSR